MKIIKIQWKRIIWISFFALLICLYTLDVDFHDISGIKIIVLVIILGLVYALTSLKAIPKESKFKHIKAKLLLIDGETGSLSKQPYVRGILSFQDIDSDNMYYMKTQKFANGWISLFSFVYTSKDQQNLEEICSIYGLELDNTYNLIVDENNLDNTKFEDEMFDKKIRG